MADLPTLRPRTEWAPCFILCAGDAIRIKGACKQLLDVGNGETILARIVRQVKARGGTPVIVTHNLTIVDAFPEEMRLIPAKRRWTCETLGSLLGLSVVQYCNVVLLGDVIYSKDAMDRIFRVNEPAVFFGNEWEIYALFFRRDGLPNLVKAVEKATAWGGEGKGKLRRVWQALYGLPQGDAFEEDLIEYVGSGDYTTDIDTKREYYVWLIKSKGRLDDKT
jgi:hypothetical protein